MTAVRLHSWRAWRQGWINLSQHPWPLLGFSAAVLALHLLGWALFAAGERSDSGVLSVCLHLLGLVLYGASLLWMVEGLGRGGLAIARQKPMSWRALWRWRGRRSWRLIRSLAAMAAAAAATALVSLLITTLLTPLLIGFVAEALVQGIGVAATALACVGSLPLVATTVAQAYLQLLSELPPTARLKPRAR